MNIGSHNDHRVSIAKSRQRIAGLEEEDAEDAAATISLTEAQSEACGVGIDTDTTDTDTTNTGRTTGHRAGRPAADADAASEGQLQYLKGNDDNNNNTINNNKNSNSVIFKWRRMDPSLGSAVAPLLRTPLVPICRGDERARAKTCAVYYSECFLRGIPPSDADRAAHDTNSLYQKWWVNSKKPPPRSQSSPSLTNKNTSETMTMLKPGTSIVSTFSSCKRKKHHDSSDDGQTKVNTKTQTQHAQGDHKRQRRMRGGLREIIDDVTFELHNQNLAATTITTTTTYTTSDSLPGDLPRTAVSLADEGDTADMTENRSLPFTIQCIPNLLSISTAQIKAIRDELLQTLKLNGGRMDDATIQAGLSILESHYLSSDLDACRDEVFPHDLNGTWLTVSRPTYTECQGSNASGEPMYTLGRMSFDMFRPTGLPCSIQGTFNTVQLLDASKGELPYSMPRRIQKELGKSLQHGTVKGLRTYNIIVAFTVEPNNDTNPMQNQAQRSTNKARTSGVTSPIRGIMTSYGYLLPDPHVPNRLSVWFTGGSLEVNDEEQDLTEWKRIFEAPEHRDVSEYARLLAAKVLLGAVVPDQMEPDGTLNYTLKRPIGGHGSAFCDVLYMDEKVRIMRGHGGSLFCLRKVQ